MRDVAIVGGGITGLSVAYMLRYGTDDRSPPPGHAPTTTLLEASPRFGGKVRTVEFDGIPLDVGADAFLARRPEGERLVRRLGLADRMETPRTGQVWLWTRGRLRPLPEGTVLGAPASLIGLLRSGVLSPRGVIRAALEPLLPREPRLPDRSVADLVDERYGSEVTDRLVEPLLGGVYAGVASGLSVAATAPPLDDAARSGRSVVMGLRRHRRMTRRDGRPVFFTIRGGLGTVIDALVDAVDDQDLRRNVPVRHLERAGEGWRLELADGHKVDARTVVLTVPAFAAAPLLKTVAPRASDELRDIEYASVAVVSLAYPPEAASQAPEGSGMLVPRSEGRLVKAATWSSRKWPHYAEHDHFLVRCSVGRIGDSRALDLADDALIHAADEELREAMGLRLRPLAARVTRWDRALPQYGVGHRERVQTIRGELEESAPGIHVAGAAYDGVGLAPCVAQAERVAEAILR